MIRMPLKLKLGRSSGRYELSEEIYILTIFIGEVPMAQCTLTSLSTSADVFRYLGEKLNLNQPEIFGLQYQMKATDTEKRMMRWIEPDKPIRRQLERWACRRGQKWAVNLAILHACSNVFTLHDTTSRSVYYTLLKCDVLHSTKLSIDIEKCVNLAAYQLQIEFPDVKPNVHYLKMLQLFPESMRRSIENDETYARIMATYEKLHTMQPAYAALLYIVEVQQCEGYGEEAFDCKEATSLELVLLGYSLDFIFVRRPNGTAQKFKWEEVREIVANKRKMSIKYGDNLATSIFCFEDNEMARYVSTVLNWKWRHARTDAQQQRSARLSVQNLQGGVPTFSQPGSFLRRSNTNMNAIRPSAELNGNGGFISTTNSCQFLPATPQLSARADQSSQSTVHSVQSCAVRQQPVNASLSVCCRSISMSQVPPNVPTPLVVRPTPAEKVSPPSAAFYPPGVPAPSQMPPPPPIPLSHPPPLGTASAVQQTSNSSQDSDWLRNEQREVLKRMVTEQRKNKLNKKTGSSPEINTLGKSVSGSGAKCKRNHIGRNSGFSLARKFFTSTPNLHTVRNAPQQQQQPQPPLTPTFTHMGNGNGLMPLPSPLANHRLLVNPPVNTAALALPPFCSPQMVPHHNGMNGNGATAVGFYLPTQSVPTTPRLPPATFSFSKGQVIDENGQQRTIIYPVPAEASSSTTLVASQPIQQQSQQQQQSSPPPQQHPALPSYSPPLNHIVAMDESRSSPKSNATSSAHSEPPTHCALQSATSTAEQKPKGLPDDADFEFTAIPAVSPNADFSVALRPHNLHRNRGSKIYPYNENRVKLTGTKANPDGYINASEVSVPVGKNTQLRYIISQAPIQKTIQDFWQMVWEAEAQLIVMLVNPHQINKDDTIPSYIPSQAKPELDFGEFSLNLRTVSPPMQMQMFQSTTTFTLEKQGQQRTLYHLYCADFSEQGVPSSMETFIGLIDAVASVKRYIENEAKKEAPAAVSKSNSNTSKESRSSNEISRRERTQSAENGGWTKKVLRWEQNGHSKQNSPPAEQQKSALKPEPLTVVQCTDGASESGVYLLAEVIIKCIEKNASFDIGQLLRELRHQRMCLVKNAQQYKFVHELVSHYERQNRLV